MMWSEPLGKEVGGSVGTEDLLSPCLASEAALTAEGGRVWMVTGCAAVRIPDFPAAQASWLLCYDSHSSRGTPERTRGLVCTG
jgi:hypothetical protein